MGLRDVFHFKEEVYTAKVQSTPDARVLRKKHHMKTVLLISSSASVGIGIALAVPSFGLSLLGTSYSTRQIYVLNAQRDVIEAEFRRRGLEVPRTRKRDIAAGAALGVFSLGLVVLLPIGLHDLGGVAAASALGGGVVLNPGDAV